MEKLSFFFCKTLLNSLSRPVGNKRTTKLTNQQIYFSSKQNCADLGAWKALIIPTTFLPLTGMFLCAPTKKVAISLYKWKSINKLPLSIQGWTEVSTALHPSWHRQDGTQVSWMSHFNTSLWKDTVFNISNPLVWLLKIHPSTVKTHESSLLTIFQDKVG